MSVAIPLVRSHFSGPGTSRSGGSAVEWSDPDVDAVDAAVGHLDDLGADHAVVLRRDAAQRLARAHGLADGRLDRHEIGIAPQEGADRDEVLGGLPCATTAGSAPSVSTRSQSWVMGILPAMRPTQPAGARSLSALRSPTATVRRAPPCFPAPGPPGLDGSRCPTVRDRRDRRARRARSVETTVEGSVVATGSSASVQLAEHQSEHPIAPALSSGSLPLPHLGDCTHDGQPRRALARLDGRRRRVPPGAELPEPAVGESGASRIAVVDEDRRRPGFRPDGHRHAADVAAVAAGDQGQQSDCRMFGGVQRAGNAECRRYRCAAVPPDRSCTSRPSCRACGWACRGRRSRSPRRRVGVADSRSRCGSPTPAPPRS